MKRIFTFVITILCLLYGGISQAQDTRGTDFWLSFGSNANTVGSTATLILEIRLVADAAATGTITFTESGETVPFSIAAGSVTTYDLTPAQKLAAYNSTGPVTNNKTIRIQSDIPISVYALNSYAALAEATGILPVTVLGTDYYHLGRLSTSENDQYIAIATDNNTTIYENGTPVATNLSAGQVYFKRPAANMDMSGYHITSNNPIAYFTAHNYCTINGGGDNFFQQLPPVNTWGKDFLVPVTNRELELVRVLASQDGTVLNVTGGTVSPVAGSTNSLNLNAGQWVELLIRLADKGCYIQSNNPVLVSSYMVGANYGNGVVNPGGYGDESQTFISPIEQALDSVLIAPFPTVNVQNPASSLTLHYALIVTPTATKNSTTVSVGGAAPVPLSSGTWYDNPASGMSFYSTTLANDATTSYLFYNEAKLVVYGYGYGSYISYYYMAGSDMRNLEAAFFVNDISSLDFGTETICSQPSNFRAELSGDLSTSPGFLKWYIDDVEETAARDQQTWSKSLSGGIYQVKLVALLNDDKTTKTIEAVMTVIDNRANSDTVQTITNQPVNVAVLANDSLGCCGIAGITGLSATGGTHGTAAISGTTLTYTPANGFSGRDSVTYTYECSGQTNTAKVYVTVIPLPPSVAPDTSYLCSPGSVTLTATAPSGTPVSWQWYRDGTLIAGATSATYPASQAGKYTATLFDGVSTSAMSGDTAVVIPAPDIQTSLPDIQTTVNGNTLTVTVGITNQGSVAINPPVYVTIYQEKSPQTYTAADVIVTGSVNAPIAAGGSARLVLTVTDVARFLPMTSIVARLNDNGSVFPFQPECNYDNNLTVRSSVLYKAFYVRGALNPGGILPSDSNNYYLDGETVTLETNEGPLTAVNAAFIGWSFTDPGAVITDSASVPSGMMQPGYQFTITRDTLIYPVFAEDKSGPGGTPDSIPDYLQHAVIYDKGLSDGGAPPVDGNLYNSGDGATVKDNENTLALTGATFIGWSPELQPAAAASPADVPSVLLQPGNTLTVVSDTTLYAVFAVDENGPGGTPDSIPDYLQHAVVYDPGLSDSGAPPVDGNLYNSGDGVTVKDNENTLALVNATFTGWSPELQAAVATAPGDIPSVLLQPGDILTVTGDTTLYAVFAEDKSGPGGTPDSIPDYLQHAVTYDGGLATGGTPPVDGNLYNTGDNATVKDNGNTLALDSATFIGWSPAPQGAVITSPGGVPSVLLQPGDLLTVTGDTTLYAIFAVDKSGPGDTPDSIPDYLQGSVTYDGNGANSGTVPVDGNLYNGGDNATVLPNGSPLKRDSAVFTGWSGNPSIRGRVVADIADVPADLHQAGDLIAVAGDTTLYAVWAEDVSGPGGTPDSIPDYLQVRVLYDGNGNDAGSVPVDGNLYNPGDAVTVKGNTGTLEKTDAVFIGWSGDPSIVGTVITVRAQEPADLVQGGNTITAGQPVDTTLYAVWAEDKNGPGGVSDSVPDYLQITLTYIDDPLHPSVTGTVPSPNPTMHTKGSNITVRGNTGNLVQDPADSVIFIGWTVQDNNPHVKIPDDLPGTLYMAGDVIVAGESDIDLYPVWAKDVNGNGIPDFAEPEIDVRRPDGTEWPVTDPYDPEDLADPDNPESPDYKPKAPWYPEYDEPGRGSLYAGCAVQLTVVFPGAASYDRDVEIGYAGALKREYLVDAATGGPLEDIYVLPKGETVLRLYVQLADSIPAEDEGKTGAITGKIRGMVGGAVPSEMLTLYNEPYIELPYIRPYFDGSGTADFRQVIRGGTPNLMRSVNGYPWINAYLPLTRAERDAFVEGATVWLREPYGCWEGSVTVFDYADPDVQRFIDLTDIPGDVTVNWVKVNGEQALHTAGRNYVKGHQDFEFNATFAGGEPYAVEALGYYSHRTVRLYPEKSADGSYTYLIRQVVEPWTVRFITTEIESQITGVEPVPGVKVWTHGNVLTVSSAGTVAADIYTMAGTLYGRLAVTPGSTRKILPKGVYVVVIDNRRFKVVSR